MRLVLLMLLLVSACAPLRGPSGRSRPAGRAPVTETRVGPERAASDSLVREGEGYMGQGSYDRAGDTFREAIDVDPTNGAAFYWLSLVKFRVGEYGEVWGLIDRAESLVGSDPEWLSKIEELKRELETTKPD